MNDDINDKMNLVRDVLDDVYQLLQLFHPIINKMKASGDYKKYNNDGKITQIADISEKISLKSKDIAKYAVAFDILSN